MFKNNFTITFGTEKLRFHFNNILILTSNFQKLPNDFTSKNV